jgi:hypothetical protein
LNRVKTETDMMTEITTEMTSKTEVVDEFLEKFGTGLPGHIIDFALDVRSIIAELEAARTAEPVGA